MKKKTIAATLVLSCAAPVALVAGAGVVGIGKVAGSGGSNEAICAGSTLSVSFDGELPAGVGSFTPQAMKQAAVIMRVGESEGIPASGQLVASGDDDSRISAAVRALAAGTGLKNTELAPVLGIHRASVFPKLKGETSWKASEVATLARYFDVPVGNLFDGLGVFGDAKRPHLEGGASLAGASSGIRTPDPLIKSQLL